VAATTALHEIVEPSSSTQPPSLPLHLKSLLRTTIFSSLVKPQTKAEAFISQVALEFGVQHHQAANFMSANAD
jgi:hypothetical protein